QSAVDYLSAWFENDTIKSVLAYYASIGTFAGPRSPGTAYVIMHHLMGEHQGAGGWGFVRGGMGAITAAIARSGARFGMPFVTPVVPTIVDDSLAPAGKHVINIFGGHAPYKLKDGASWADEKRNLTKAVLDVIDEMAPGFSGQVIEAETLVAPDLEAIVGLPQGHIFHGELSADQLFWQRPAPHWADYRTPITGLYQCGSSTHPGGGVSGIP